MFDFETLDAFDAELARLEEAEADTATSADADDE